uniref:Uncharacterized protein n=1 Tax=Chromera velia CCMP2878 TaxID=1169474 RepID=A0A0G4GW97_9ALVE|eukprot:Cvel_23678.t1-p1 / transcript=Cvel_23678.t1 / gene=Cvel_23678 / organism=Chromera_velia_CCMP2878 / gene_product=hypothetical protein / transcript_product=hypothetical protein / location=Cvel_scaffold2468:6361-12590(+) / protein_length=540 / sequence_SO=supercontig / SO=protein_coding / is_pseudo=false
MSTFSQSLSPNEEISFGSKAAAGLRGSVQESLRAERVLHPHIPEPLAELLTTAELQAAAENRNWLQRLSLDSDVLRALQVADSLQQVLLYQITFFVQMFNMLKVRLRHYRAKAKRDPGKTTRGPTKVGIIGLGQLGSAIARHFQHTQQEVFPQSYYEQTAEKTIDPDMIPPAAAEPSVATTVVNSPDIEALAEHEPPLGRLPLLERSELLLISSRQADRAKVSQVGKEIAGKIKEGSNPSDPLLLRNDFSFPLDTFVDASVREVPVANQGSVKGVPWFLQDFLLDPLGTSPPKYLDDSLPLEAGNRRLSMALDGLRKSSVASLSMGSRRASLLKAAKALRAASKWEWLEGKTGCEERRAATLEKAEALFLFPILMMEGEDVRSEEATPTAAAATARERESVEDKNPKSVQGEKAADGGKAVEGNGKERATVGFSETAACGLSRHAKDVPVSVSAAERGNSNALPSAFSAGSVVVTPSFDLVESRGGGGSPSSRKANSLRKFSADTQEDQRSARESFRATFDALVPPIPVTVFRLRSSMPL